MCMPSKIFSANVPHTFESFSQNYKKPLMHSPSPLRFNHPPKQHQTLSFVFVLANKWFDQWQSDLPSTQHLPEQGRFALLYFSFYEIHERKECNILVNSLIGWIFLTRDFSNFTRSPEKLWILNPSIIVQTSNDEEQVPVERGRGSHWPAHGDGFREIMKRQPTQVEVLLVSKA